MPPKIVFDTNIFISAIIFGGSPRICLEMARNGEIELYTSKVLLVELASKLQDKFGWDSEDVTSVILGISKFATITQPSIEISKIRIDPSDNRVLEVAREINADFIISGDKKHILSLRKFGKTKIVSAAEFLRRFSPQSS